MESPGTPTDPRVLRVLLAGQISGASLALAGWLQDHGQVTVVGPLPTVAAVQAVAATLPTHVILVDGDNVDGAMPDSIRTFKQLVPAPAVVVLTHGTSDAFRRHCAEARADAVFDRIRDLDSLSALLGTVRATLAGTVLATGEERS